MYSFEIFNWQVMVDKQDMLWWFVIIGIFVIGFITGSIIIGTVQYYRGKRKQREEDPDNIIGLTNQNIVLKERNAHLENEIALWTSTGRIIEEALLRKEKGLLKEEKELAHLPEINSKTFPSMESITK